jgi:hypothetical protein
LSDRTPNPAVITEAAAFNHWIAADVVIRATGNPWPLRMKRFPPRFRDDRPDVLVIDFDDRFCPVAVDHTNRRRSAYDRVGMEIATHAERSA